MTTPKTPGDIAQVSPFAGLKTVKKGDMPSASQQNAIVAALRGNYGRNDYPGASGGAAKLFKTPIGGIAAATGSGPYTWGSASCTPVNADGTLGSGTVTVYNIVNQAIAGSVPIKAAPVDSIWVVDVASCGS